MISAVTVTYGRIGWLNACIADLLAQEYSEPREHLILNTCPRQTLEGDFPNVRILNLKKRPKSLGEARNMAVEAAAGDRILVVDDDDAYLPHFLRTFDEHWTQGLDWVWLDKRLCAMGDEIKEISYGCHGGCFGFTKRAWEAVGRYPDNLSVGEDRVLVGNITKAFNGTKILLGDTMPPFICCWGNGTYHISGQGNDRANVPGAYVRVEADLTRRIASGKEKIGTIRLQPKRSGDWPTRAKLFMEATLKKNYVNEVCVIELGRYGDIVNLLPVLQHMANTHGKPHLMVSREFADLLDGVSYVIPHPVDIPNDHLEAAIRLAHKEFSRVIVAQVWGGPLFYQEKLCPSYNMESWRMAGFRHKFTDYSWRPLFDRRDRDREKSLVDKVCTDKPMLLVNLTHSTSSPFPQGASLLQIVRSTLGKDLNVVDVGSLKLHRIYDLLGLMEASACILSIDTALLHLAAAVPVPCFALVNDAPWLGSECRGQHFVRMHYAEAVRSAQALCQSIRRTVESRRVSRICFSPSMALTVPPTRRLFHCVEQHTEKNRSETVRKAQAQKSWEPLYAQGVIRCCLEEEHYPRTARDIGEKRKLPYLKDVLNLAMKQAQPDDIIFFTNDDIVLHPELPELLRFHVGVYECCSASRCEFKGRPMPPMNRPPSEFAQLGNPHMGRDLFAFTKRWLESHWQEMPDFILGASEFDLCMATMIRNHFGIRTSRQNLEAIIHPAELPRGYISHSFHSPFWNTPANVNTAPSQIWNRTRFRDWAAVHAPQLRFDQHLCV